MSVDLHIEPVADDRRNEALGYLLTGRTPRPGRHAQAEAFDQTIRRRAVQVDLWWALRKGRCVAAAMTAENPGRSAQLFYGPPGRGADTQVAAELIRSLCAATLARNVAFIQAVTERRQRRIKAVLAAAGFEHLAELDSMQIDLPHASPDRTGPSLRWRTRQQWRPNELADVLTATYQESLDCPKLNGLRGPGDVIAGHQSLGVFCPQTWWIVDVDDRAAGCCLVNDTSDPSAGMIVYLGVAAPLRGRGLGRTMIRHVADVATRRGKSALTLAVDLRNTYALNVYRAEGFRVIDSRTALLITSKTLTEGAM